MEKYRVTAGVDTLRRFFISVTFSFLFLYLERLRSLSTDDTTGGVELNLTLRFPDHVTLDENTHTRTFKIFLPCFSDRDSEPLEGSRWTYGGFIVDDLSIPQDEPAPLPGFDLAAHLQQVAGLLQHLQRLLQTPTRVMSCF